MDEQQNSQPESSPGEGPGLVTEVPQAAPAANRSPDSLNMPRTGQAVARQEERDWEKSFKGLNRWVGEEFNTLRDTVGDLARAVQTLTERPQAAPAPAPTPDSNEGTAVKEEPSALDMALEAKKAERYRDMLLEEYEAATGLPVTSFRQHVKAVAPALGEDGALDDSAQRALIEDLVGTLKGVRGDAQEQVLKGHMPGSAPGSDAPTSADQLYDEFLDIMQVYGTEEFDRLDPAKRAAMENRYFELLQEPAVQDRHEGALQPAMGYEDMAEEVRRLSREIETLKGQRPSHMA